MKMKGQLFLMRVMNDEEEEESHEKYVWYVLRMLKCSVHFN